MKFRYKWLLTVLLLSGVGCPKPGAQVDQAAQPSNQPRQIREASLRQEESGLAWADIVLGSGVSAQDGYRLQVHYTGWLTSGEKFDSSRDRDRPLDVVLGKGRFIKGWEEGLLGIRPGGIRQLVIPPELAYGDSSKPGIPPGSTLVFEVECLSIAPIVPAGTPRQDLQYAQTESGLRISDIVVGGGPELHAGQSMVVNYTGWLENGEVFDSTEGQPRSLPFGKGRLIQGWEEGLDALRVGGVRQLVVPPWLAYGERGAPPRIPPNATLVFEIELVAVE